jgi:hypothetical protein
MDENDKYECLLGHQFLNGEPRIIEPMDSYYRMKELLRIIGIEGIRKMDYEQRCEKAKRDRMYGDKLRAEREAWHSWKNGSVPVGG